MIRNLKVLLLAALSVCALSAVAASSAQAAAAFTAPGAGAAEVTTLKLLPDGAGKVAHQVFIIKNAAESSSVSITCNEIGGTPDGITGSSTTAILLTTPTFGAAGVGSCKDSTGQTAIVTNTGCDFEFTAQGVNTTPALVHIKSEKNAVAPNLCKHGEKPIDIVTPTCKVEVGEQTIEGIKYKNLADGTVTVEGVGLKGLTYNAKGASCEFGTTHNGEYATGAAIVTGERGGAMKEVKWDE